MKAASEAGTNVQLPAAALSYHRVYQISHFFFSDKRVESISCYINPTCSGDVDELITVVKMTIIL